MRFPAECSSLNSVRLLLGKCPCWALDSIRMDDVDAGISSHLALSTPPGWQDRVRDCRQAERRVCAVDEPRVHRTCLGDYLLSPGVEFPGQSPQLAADRLRTPGRENFTSLSLSQASVPLPREVRHSTCLQPRRVSLGCFSQNSVAPGTAPLISSSGPVASGETLA